MGHKVLIGGTSYEIKGGKTLINGTAYSITKGRTMIGGTGYDVSFSSVSSVFGENDFVTIKAESLAGNAPILWNVGDKKPITLTTGQTVNLVIAGFNHDLDADGNTIGITLVLEDCLNEKYAMNSSNTNVGGWASCTLRTTLNNTILAQLPSELQAVITAAVKKSSAGGQSSTINNSTDKLWLLSEIELFGATTYSFSGEGTQYSVFPDNASRIKLVNGALYPWSERSPSTTNTISYGYVKRTGEPLLGGGATTPYGVCFGLCI